MKQPLKWNFINLGIEQGPTTTTTMISGWIALITCIIIVCLPVEKVWYSLSKTLAERAAWEFAKENKIDLVTVLPSFLVGPSLPTDLSPTASDILALLRGNAPLTVPSLPFERCKTANGSDELALGRETCIDPT